MSKLVAILSEEQQDNITSLNSMIESCFTYGGADRDSHNFERYIKPFEIKLGKELFDFTYQNTLYELKENYKVEQNVYTDCEGLNYNSLVKN